MWGLISLLPVAALLEVHGPCRASLSVTALKTIRFSRRAVRLGQSSRSGHAQLRLNEDKPPPDDKASAKDDLSFGAMLASIVDRQIKSLPRDEQRERDARSVDAIIDYSRADLQAVVDELDVELDGVQRATEELLASELNRTKADTFSKIDAVSGAMLDQMESSRASRKQLQEGLAQSRLEEVGGGFAGGMGRARQREIAITTELLKHSPVGRLVGYAASALGVLVLAAAVDVLAGKNDAMATLAGIDHAQAVRAWQACFALSFLTYMSSLAYLIWNFDEIRDAS
uniref:Uncharacterized protein n=1 Tax=Chrysotila carterae TaxID=13221 RepID=A0A7S4AY15_CHRCT|mmetsp:Transcript_40381/g.88656  ORF Transcript_40381/g.88656 Transcript_40381/m.88656 type:complete len:285 (-) Transcript_40381:579-1433(-)